jgi:hypothetical protein
MKSKTAEAAVPAHLHDGKLHVNQRRLDAALSRMMDGDVILRVEPRRATRSNAQLALYWVGYIEPLCEYSGYEPGWMHQFLKTKFLVSQREMVPEPDGSVLVVAPKAKLSVRRLTETEFGDYLRSIEIWAHDEFGMLLGSREKETAV